MRSYFIYIVEILVLITLSFVCFFLSMILANLIIEFLFYFVSLFINDFNLIFDKDVLHYTKTSLTLLVAFMLFFKLISYLLKTL